MRRRDSGFTMLELMAVLLIIGVIAAFAMPQAITAVKNYRLHADATSIASYLNVTRMRATSQFVPYRLGIDTSAGTFVIERLCGTGCSSYYSPKTPQVFEYGTQYASTGDTFSACLPATVPAGNFPPPLTADDSNCPSTPPNPVYFYFNTRGSPVDYQGNPLTNGGVTVYFTNQDNLTDAVTVSLGGRVAVYNWSVPDSKWYRR